MFLGPVLRPHHDLFCRLRKWNAAACAQMQAIQDVRDKEAEGKKGGKKKRAEEASVDEEEDKEDQKESESAKESESTKEPPKKKRRTGGSSKTAPLKALVVSNALFQDDNRNCGTHHLRRDTPEQKRALLEQCKRSLSERLVRACFLSEELKKAPKAHADHFPAASNARTKKLTDQPALMGDVGNLLILPTVEELIKPHSSTQLFAQRHDGMDPDSSEFKNGPWSVSACDSNDWKEVSEQFKGIVEQFRRKQAAEALVRLDRSGGVPPSDQEQEEPDDGEVDEDVEERGGTLAQGGGEARGSQDNEDDDAGEPHHENEDSLEEQEEVSAAASGSKLSKQKKSKEDKKRESKKSKQAAKRQEGNKASEPTSQSQKGDDSRKGKDPKKKRKDQSEDAAKPREDKSRKEDRPQKGRQRRESDEAPVPRGPSAAKKKQKRKAAKASQKASDHSSADDEDEEGPNEMMFVPRSSKKNDRRPRKRPESVAKNKVTCSSSDDDQPLDKMKSAPSSQTQQENSTMLPDLLSREEFEDESDTESGGEKVPRGKQSCCQCPGQETRGKSS